MPDQRRETFDQLMSEHQNKVFRLACTLLGNQALAEEAAQETFIRVWKAMDSFRGDSSASTWIYSIARNTCLTLRKSRGLSETALDSTAIERIANRQQSPPSAGHSIDWERALAGLPAKYRQVIMLYYMQEKSYEEVSEMLDLPLGTVKTYLFRGKKELATALAGSRMGVRDGLSRV